MLYFKFECCGLVEMLFLFLFFFFFFYNTGVMFLLQVMDLTFCIFGTITVG